MSMTIDISDNLPLTLDVSIYGENEKISDTLSKCRVRIFYKGLNRNRTYISEEFAQELINSLPYAPIKGIFNYTDVDYEDHGEDNTDGRIYGIIPENPNFAWEKHLDKDGIEREYATADVYLFTGLYPESSLIKDKPQSMELFKQTLEGEWRISEEDGKPVFYFLHGSLVGLQVLGKDVEPCFEGAAFFNLFKDIQNCVEYIKKLQFSKMEGDKMQVDKSLFRLSDNEKAEAIFDAINPNYNEEGDWTCDYSVCEVYDEYALAFNYEAHCYERVYYTKDDSNDSVTLGERVKVFIVDVTETEKATLDTLRALNGDTYELVNENLTNAERNANDCAEFSTKIEELNNTIATLNTEAENAQAKIAEIQTQYNDAQAQNSALSEENESLKTYKKNIENQSKEAVVAEYTDKLAEDVLNAYKSKFDEYTAEELDMHLAYELKKMNASVFTQAPSGRIPKDNAGRSGVEEILARYKR